MKTKTKGNYKFELKNKKKNKFIHMINGMFSKKQKNNVGQFLVYTYIYNEKTDKYEIFETMDVTNDIINIMEKFGTMFITNIIQEKIEETLKIFK